MESRWTVRAPVMEGTDAKAAYRKLNVTAAGVQMTMQMH